MEFFNGIIVSFDDLYNSLTNNNDPSPIVTKEIICNSLKKEYKLCLMEISNNIYHPKCSEIKKIIYKSKKLLKLKGKLIFEIGNNQMLKSVILLKKNGFYINNAQKDLSNNDRCIVSTKI